MLNAKFYPQLRAVLSEIEAFMSMWQRDEAHYRLLQRALGKLRRDFFSDKVFPAMVVPTLAWQSLRRDESQALYLLNAAHFLFYAFLDLTDDVEDGELDDPLWQQLGAPIATNAGTSFCFAALLMLDRLASHGVKPKQVAELKTMFVESGWFLTIGQHRDLASARHTDLDAAAVLETHRLKTGTSVRLYLESAAVLARAKPAQREHFAALGESLGVMVQIIGDWINVQRPYSSDLANHCQSLPLVLLRRALPLDDRDVFQAAWLAAPKDQAAHMVMRHLLRKHEVAIAMDELLDARRSRVLESIEALRRSGCEVRDLERFVARFGSIVPKAGGV